MNIPQIACIRGTPQRRVILYFADMDEKINCPLDYHKVRLLRRFGRIKRQGRVVYIELTEIENLIANRYKTTNIVYDET